ncbi:hypothetical protein IB276_26140 [Ensifer sp. ENS04]|uniref:hypothetical protein n=1 Tax=Ensifer sp. ENS04 TaxID=2769281 RepID=UPI00177B69D5|nr:hypothetical protein [Ensifer sp. ENS04]MBD9542931.1 hypothetical protein [Ensifer sp. ENS04]
MSFVYTMKAIPTAYAGVNFRSRLEAQWAAFFDLAGIRWQYEPIDLEGWAPDFLLYTSLGHILVEVKPVDAHLHDLKDGVFDKAFQYWSRHQILLLGLGPIEMRDLLGIILDPPDNAQHGWLDVMDALHVTNSDALWREAGNVVQWKPGNTNRRRRSAA